MKRGKMSQLPNFNFKRATHLLFKKKKKKQPHLLKDREELCENLGKRTSLRGARILAKEKEKGIPEKKSERKGS